ncbi:MAG: Asp-tRNA(Asn)/Glu-tRNA(Gln) amidotransferase subunit GatC [Patescibacteria group bacterium]
MKIDVSHIAKLANLQIKEDKKEKFQKQLFSILQYINKLKEVATENIEPTSQVTGLENVTREDEAKPSLSQEEVLKNAKSVHNGLFKVKTILDG